MYKPATAKLLYTGTDRSEQTVQTRSGPEAIKLEYILNVKLNKSALVGCFRAHARKQPISVLYFEFEIILKFYNLEPCLQEQSDKVLHCLSFHLHLIDALLH